MAIKKGDIVRVHYTGTLDNGNVFDSSETRGEPLEFEVGSGQLIKSFDDAVLGLNEGDKKSITIPAADAYGEYMAEMVRKVPKEFLAQLEDPKPGMLLALADAEGNQINAKITEVTEQEITLDLNHPLAGQTLHFSITVVQIVS